MNSNEIPDKIKEKLYKKVLELFSEKDFHQVNIREIAKKSGISVGTIYKYFTSKQDLVFTVIDEYLCELNDLIRVHVQGIENPKEIFRKLFWVTMDFYDRNRGVAITGFITVPMRNWMQKNAYRRDDIREVLGDILEKVKANNGIQPDMDVRTLNNLYFMFCSRHVLIWYYHGMKWNLADKISDFFELFWRILEPKKQ
ncbi:MAG TPA: TetR/AcrR family transcriptional regulator [Spirochaetota bacterium]|nr:TetR/AcrR family transcriptional regulator [Spirochaetota bacterium]HPJ36973.1 TetR/AcrR family transcriptional regulator [Spirochaetota bacterium]HPQ51761.1 TetR/AcrR family transcriptional regulator [Spirochaetota bacterium]